MSEQTAQEPTMEEILASIRRIISEDEPAPGAEAPAEAAPEPEPAEDVLELTQRVDETPPHEPAPAETVGDIEAYAPAPAPVMTAVEPEPRPRPAPAYTLPADDDDDDVGIVSAPTAGAAASSFGRMAQSLAMPKDGRTLEDVVRELLKPLLKAWLDENLPAIVEAKVEAEVERIARLRVG